MIRTLPRMLLVVLATAAFAIWNVGIAVLVGIMVHQGARRGWLRI